MDNTTASRSLTVEAPATGETLDTIALLDAEAVEDLARRARAAQPAWHEAGFAARAAVLDRARRWMFANADRLIETICAETGKTFEDAQLEIGLTAQGLRFWARSASRYLAEERVSALNPLTLGRSIRVRYEPAGLVGVIAPWNFPLVNGFLDCIPALMAGNAVLLKPSEVTPLTATLAVGMLTECGLPDDVFLVADGDGSTGAAVVDVSDRIMFTGSTRTGREVMRRGAETMTPVSLELGGKDPMIVCADADLDRAANVAAYYGLINSGQACMSVERVFVEREVHDEFVAKLVDIVGGLRVGPSRGPGTVEIGALTHPPQIDIVATHVDDAVARGATVEIGGRRVPGPGRFYEPTVLSGVTPDMKCMREETFGPTIPVMAVDDAEQAVRLANDTTYGLQASVFTRSIAKGRRIARRLQVGGVGVNDAVINYAAMGAPMGGWKESGVGSRHGAQGIRKFCNTQTVMTNRFALKRDPNMFPYTPRVSKIFGRVLGAVYGR